MVSDLCSRERGHGENADGQENSYRLRAKKRKISADGVYRKH